MITVEQAIGLKFGQTIYDVEQRGSDGRAVRWRVNGQVKTWKTRPSHFKIPVKHGLYNYGYVTHENAMFYSVNEPENE